MFSDLEYNFDQTNIHTDRQDKQTNKQKMPRRLCKTDKSSKVTQTKVEKSHRQKLKSHTHKSRKVWKSHTDCVEHRPESHSDTAKQINTNMRQAQEKSLRLIDAVHTRGCINILQKCFSIPNSHVRFPSIFRLIKS